MKHLRPTYATLSRPPGPVDVMVMASVLVRRHGPFAPKISEFMVREHAAREDSKRIMAWRAVSASITDILAARHAFSAAVH